MRRKGIWSSDGLHYFPSRRAMREEQLRKLVLDATQQLLEAVGPRGFTVKETARRAGVARTTIYKYFRDKAGLLAACRAHVARTGSRKLKWSTIAARAHAEKQRRRSALRPGLTAVRHAVLALVEGLEVQSDLFLLTAGEAVRCRRAPKYPYGALQAPLPRQFFRAVVDLLQDAKARGELKPSVEPLQVAVWVAALWWHELTMRGPRFDRSQPGSASRARPAWPISSIASSGRSVWRNRITLHQPRDPSATSEANSTFCRHDFRRQLVEVAERKREPGHPCRTPRRHPGRTPRPHPAGRYRQA